ncbi:MAG: methyltransferase domain-containing protein [Candidatus Jorgensenbacteria bacterium]|nr:methyltransferase domain-containing protein [Candidatus Jorgensenbacteria bacterium]
MNKDILKTVLINPNAPRVLKHGHLFVLATFPIDTQSPFIVRTYDFDNKFYKGKFLFKDPTTDFPIMGTPEEYGRKRIVANLNNLGLKNKTIIDIGAGTLNIYRQIPAENSRLIAHFINCDISGPWNNKNRSSMEIGAERTKIVPSPGNVINVQYDFNSLMWPFQPNIFNYAVSCMAMHHIKFENKANVLKSIFKSLRRGGEFIITDFFLSEEGGAKITNAGQRGPEECKGYGQKFSDFLNLCQKAGFILDKPCRCLMSSQSLLTSYQLKTALNDTSKTLQINKATWYTVLSKK